MNDHWPPHFLYTVCQRGAEGALKREMDLRLPGAKLAFSRPGFVTFKLAEACTQPERFKLPAAFARAWGFPLGKVSGSHAQQLAEQVWQLPAVEQFLASTPIGALHVWQRDAAMPGRRGFQPGPTPLAEEVEQTIRSRSPIESLRSDSNQGHSAGQAERQPAPRNRWVLDVVLVQPSEWWIGCHLAADRTACWPGGVLPIALPPYAVSRAYLKMEEALRWSALPIAHGEHCLDLGCAPGGTSQVLLEHGLHVLGVDPAEVADVVAEHPRFTHLRRRSIDIPKRQLRGIQWLVADVNATPCYTLDAAEAIATQPQSTIRGMVLTLKFTDWKLTDELPQYVERVRKWGYRDVRTRQLAHNRQELCLVALRSRSQRRVRRNSRRQLRHDAAHAGTPAGPHITSNM